MTNVLTFRCEMTSGGSALITPVIDGTSLSDLVASFEMARGYSDPAGGYTGIIPSHFRLGPLRSYFLGREEPTGGGDQGEIYSLFCECGEAGCWPLVNHVVVEGDRVTWRRFEQPHRPGRDYSQFGPFEFSRGEYDAAVEAAAAFAGES